MMKRKFKLGDLFVNKSTKDIYSYIRVSQELEDIKYEFILQSLDGLGWYDAWSTKESADNDLLHAYISGELEHYDNWSIILKEDRLVEVEKIVSRDDLGFKGGE